MQINRLSVAGPYHQCAQGFGFDMVASNIVRRDCIAAGFRKAVFSARLANNQAAPFELVETPPQVRTSRLAIHLVFASDD